ncbi:MAG TPA: hypothetical protein VKH46_06320 [Thermoanaerobaculia bacterium]|nr:hypothetical protein [Thermoanaerobaculia bacterium]
MNSATSDDSSRIPKLSAEEQDEDRELHFDLDFLASLTTQQRFDLMFERSREMAEMLRANGHSEASSIVKRP